jgi:hypothetical protein
MPRKRIRKHVAQLPGTDAGDNALRRDTDSHFLRWAAASTSKHLGRAKFDAAVSGSAMRAEMWNFPPKSTGSPAAQQIGRGSRATPGDLPT